MNCCFWMMNNNKNKIIDITNTRYYGKVDTVFTLRNDFFMCPPFHSYKILDDYDKHNIVIKETKYFFGEETHDGAGYEQYHNISFITSGKYEIHIQDLRTDASTKFPASSPNAAVLRTFASGSNKIQTYMFIIT